MKFDPSVAWTKILILANSFIAAIPNILIAALIFALFYHAGRQIRALVRRATESHRRSQSVGLVLGRLSQGVIVLVGALVALTVVFPSFNVSNLISLLGISTVAIGFAFKDIFQNFPAGILLLLAEPFRIGDQIVVKDFEGTVRDIQTRATTIDTYDGRRIVIPNTELFTEAVTVNTAYEKRRCQCEIGVGHSDDPDEAKSVILNAIGDLEGVMTDPAPEAFVVEIAASSITIRIWWWVQPPTRRNVLVVQDCVLIAATKALMENGIDIPFATQTTLFTTILRIWMCVIATAMFSMAGIHLSNSQWRHNALIHFSLSSPPLNT
ncbi:transporter [Capsulimonas corticalis]|uniref:Transporter n=1 Tax=Capsulimonas corticalis TaxID=2219043 RepID=A0A402CWB7_9BACT|nr:mechanosensitive ion channel family protein [Capsulimonas corticalis]BDI34071.1 transporter [Capsulimonas corticalis]